MASDTICSMAICIVTHATYLPNLQRRQWRGEDEHGAI